MQHILTWWEVYGVYLPTFFSIAMGVCLYVRVDAINPSLTPQHQSVNRKQMCVFRGVELLLASVILLYVIIGEKKDVI